MSTVTPVLKNEESLMILNTIWYNQIFFSLSLTLRQIVLSKVRRQVEGKKKKCGGKISMLPVRREVELICRRNAGRYNAT